MIGPEQLLTLQFDTLDETEGDILDRLEELAKLRDARVCSPEEFEAEDRQSYGI